MGNLIVKLWFFIPILKLKNRLTIHTVVEVTQSPFFLNTREHVSHHHFDDATYKNPPFYQLTMMCHHVTIVYLHHNKNYHYLDYLWIKNTKTLFKCPIPPRKALPDTALCLRLESYENFYSPYTYNRTLSYLRTSRFFMQSVGKRYISQLWPWKF